MTDQTQHYNGIAICLHWVIALLILSMLIMGIYMVELDESDPLRYGLTQWHKSFGIITLLLIVLRLFWRFSHAVPSLPKHMPLWEKQAATLAHVVLYLLILAIPISGWIMVSASPLELPTLLFNKIAWPHLPPFDSLPNKGDIAELFSEVHEIAANLLMFVLIAHIGAALRHQFVLQDNVMQRMSPKISGRWIVGVRSTFSIIFLLVASLVVYGVTGSNSVPLAAGNSQVRFEFSLQNQIQEGAFTESTVDMLIDRDNPNTNQLQATVNTATVATGNSQIDSTLASEEWFDSNNYPQAFFESKELVSVDENNYSVSGTLRIKEIAQDISFPIQLVESDNSTTASGSFTINRLDFNLGRESYASDDTAGYQVTIKFEFEVR